MDNDLIYAGKRIDELSIEELRSCALHFRAAHVKQTLDTANLIRRIDKLELLLDTNARAKLDWWLKNHPNDTYKGDGTVKYPEWTEFEPTADGYQIPNKSKRMESLDAYVKRKNL
jgi:hypothetical protein